MDNVKNYGLPYKGSKNGIAEQIINFLPQGKRLVDLFGGGGAISHCAVLSGKWSHVLYNEFDSFVYNALTSAVAGKYNNENRWVSRDEFFELKNSDPYVAFCFSYCSNLKDYAYAREIEPWKKALHYAKIFNDTSLFEEMGIYTDGSTQDISNHVDEYRSLYTKWLGDELTVDAHHKMDYFTLLQNVPRVYRLRDMSNLSKSRYRGCLTTTNGSYDEYEYKEGDVVYCDPPYENTNCGNYNGFDSQRFYDWVYSRPYQVFFSSYEITDKRFYTVWQTEKRALSSIYNITKTEYIYSNKPYEKRKLMKNRFVFG